ncbi:MAG: hypothetical protein F4145_03750 [Boseongicola sp. SB0675_bin_26]|nr:hypothetical protein [Boseongicola sp. SB0675_bin_26]
MVGGALKFQMALASKAIRRLIPSQLASRKPEKKRAELRNHGMPRNATVVMRRSSGADLVAARKPLRPAISSPDFARA